MVKASALSAPVCPFCRVELDGGALVCPACWAEKHTGPSGLSVVAFAFAPGLYSGVTVNPLLGIIVFVACLGVLKLVFRDRVVWKRPMHTNPPLRR